MDAALCPAVPFIYVQISAADGGHFYFAEDVGASKPGDLDIANLCARGGLDLEYLDLLEGHAVVDHATLSQRGARAAAASKIVDSATKVVDRVSIPPTSAAPRSSKRDDAVPPSLRPPRSVRT